MILPKYETLIIYLFSKPSQAVATDVLLHLLRNSYFDTRILLENEILFIHSDYEVALVCNSMSGRSVRTVIETALGKNVANILL